MLLEDLPEKTVRRLVKSVTWTEVDRASSPTQALRRFVSRLARPAHWRLRNQKKDPT